MITFAQCEDIPAIRKLWELCFPDDTGFNPYYFDHLFRPEYTLVARCENQFAAMLQMLPYQLRIKDDIVPVTYIYGACTHPNMRRQHWMSKLLSYSFDWDRRHGRKASILIPQEPWLFQFYAAFGYMPVFQIHEQRQDVTAQSCSALRLMQPEDIAMCQTLYQMQTQHFTMTVQRTSAQWEAQRNLFHTLGAGAFIWQDSNQISGYAFVWYDGIDGLWIQEIVGCTTQFLCALAAQTGKSKLRMCIPDTNGLPFGCIKFYDNPLSVSGYMNLMFN